jgi:predicted DNA repair protein MutK
MTFFRWMRNALVTLFCVGLAAIAWLGDHYISQSSTAPDARHIVPFAAHGDPVFVTRAENRDYFLLWASTFLIGLIGGWVCILYDVRVGRSEPPEWPIASIVTAGGAYFVLYYLNLAFQA